MHSLLISRAGGLGSWNRHWTQRERLNRRLSGSLSWAGFECRAQRSQRNTMQVNQRTLHADVFLFLCVCLSAALDVQPAKKLISTWSCMSCFMSLSAAQKLSSIHLCKNHIDQLLFSVSLTYFTHAATSFRWILWSLSPLCEIWESRWGLWVPDLQTLVGCRSPVWRSVVGLWRCPQELPPVVNEERAVDSPSGFLWSWGVRVHVGRKVEGKKTDYSSENKSRHTQMIRIWASVFRLCVRGILCVLRNFRKQTSSRGGEWRSSERALADCRLN